ncbi:hypothetical protein [Chondrinema litorale]|uniref:hypothetical protein n=1 Tax=Chondrinema litorale TaxID=2994555 RepID=UPI0025433E9F|nr:hypothetical protein [Chondrinema litorale]UZR99240.1 hypothetical protein OQ292_35245 [Chondrinema litorale]
MKKKSADLFKVITKSGGPEHPLKSLAKNTEREEPEEIEEDDDTEYEEEEPISRRPTSYRPKPTVEQKKPVARPKQVDMNSSVRQTFLIRMSMIEAIKDIVYYKKVNGNLYCTQQDVVEEAIEALLEKIGDVPERPEEERKREQQKKRGRKKKYE